MTETQVDQLQALLNNNDLWQESEELVAFFDLLESFGIQEYVQYNPKVIRGLDYYTGTVFEAFELGGKGRAIFGGGRYDNLVADVGGNALSGVGFAMGDVVVELVLQDAGVIPTDLGEKPQVLVTVFDEATLPESLKAAATLREAGLRTVIFPEAEKMGKQFKFADKLDIPVAVILGPDEVAAGQVAVKNLKTREQEVVARENLAAEVEKFLSSAM